MLILTLSILSTRLNIMKMILRNVDKITEFDEGIDRRHLILHILVSGTERVNLTKWCSIPENKLPVGMVIIAYQMVSNQKIVV